MTQHSITKMESTWPDSYIRVLICLRVPKHSHVVVHFFLQGSRNPSTVQSTWDVLVFEKIVLFYLFFQTHLWRCDYPVPQATHHRERHVLRARVADTGQVVWACC